MKQKTEPSAIRWKSSK